MYRQCYMLSPGYPGECNHKPIDKNSLELELHSQTHFHTLLCQVFARTRLHICSLHAVNDSLQSSIHSCDSAGAVGRDIEVVGEGPCCDLQHIVGSLWVHEDLAQCRDEGTRWATVGGKMVRETINKWVPAQFLSCLLGNQTAFSCSCKFEPVNFHSCAMLLAPVILYIRGNFQTLCIWEGFYSCQYMQVYGIIPILYLLLQWKLWLSTFHKWQMGKCGWRSKQFLENCHHTMCKE